MSNEEDKLKVHPENLSQEITQKLEALAVKHQVSKRKVKTEYLKTINDEFIRSDPQFKTETEREDYALSLTDVLIMRKKYQVPKRLQKKWDAYMRMGDTLP